MDEAETEVTPEMIEAGLEAYRSTRPGESSDYNEGNVVRSVFRAMILARDSIGHSDSKFC